MWLCVKIPPHHALKDELWRFRVDQWRRGLTNIRMVSGFFQRWLHRLRPPSVQKDGLWFMSNICCHPHDVCFRGALSVWELSVARSFKSSVNHEIFPSLVRCSLTPAARRQPERRNTWSSSRLRLQRWVLPPPTSVTTFSASWRAATLPPTSSCPRSACPRRWLSCPWVKTQTHKLSPNLSFGFSVGTSSEARLAQGHSVCCSQKHRQCHGTSFVFSTSVFVLPQLVFLCSLSTKLRLYKSATVWRRWTQGP